MLVLSYSVEVTIVSNSGYDDVKTKKVHEKNSKASLKIPVVSNRGTYETIKNLASESFLGRT